MGKGFTRKHFLIGAGAALVAPPIARASIGVSGRARGLMGGCFQGCLLAQQKSGPAPWNIPYATNGLVHLWDVEHSVDASLAVTDVVGGNDLTVNGTPQINANNIYLRKQGNLESARDTEFADILNNRQEWTMEFVIKSATFVSDASFILYDYQSGSHRGFHITHGGGKYAQCVEVLKNSYQIVNYGDINSRSISIKNASVGSSSGYWEAYVDGAYVGWGSYGSTTAEPSTFKFGSASAATMSDDYWYCARFYNRNLSASEIAANYAVDKERFGFA